MGIEPKDWDITTSATPEETMEVFKNYEQLNMGIDFGTVSVVIESEVFEITTYRVDGEYTDSRRPNSVEYSTDIKEDLARRDFTINAMAYSPYKGLIDPFNGEEDLKNKVIRCVGEPHLRFDEDTLRILRCARFACKYDFEIEDNTYEQMMYRLKSIWK